MKIRSGRDCAFMLTFFLLSLFAWTPASAQGHVGSRSVSPTALHAVAENIHPSRDMAPASTQKVLYNFCSAPACSDGLFPSSSLVQDAGGNLYGTVVNGGIFTAMCTGGGCGTLFKIDTSNHYSVLYSF